MIGGQAFPQRLRAEFRGRVRALGVGFYKLAYFQCLWHLKWLDSCSSSQDVVFVSLPQ